MWSSVKPLVKPNLCSLDVNDIKTLETGGAGATEDVSVEVPVDQDQWGHQRPHVEGHADPAGAHLDPHSRPAAGHGLVVCLRAAQGERTDTVHLNAFTHTQPPQHGGRYSGYSSYSTQAQSRKGI